VALRNRRIIKCPDCGSTRLYKHTNSGYSLRRQCKDCAKVFCINPKSKNRNGDRPLQKDCIAGVQIMFVARLLNREQCVEYAVLLSDGTVLAKSLKGWVVFVNIDDYVPLNGTVIDYEIDTKKIVYVPRDAIYES
jgi:DNA-directed RNA polymerase subunit RPC12/RpoP